MRAARHPLLLVEETAFMPAAFNALLHKSFSLAVALPVRSARNAVGATLAMLAVALAARAPSEVDAWFHSAVNSGVFNDIAARVFAISSAQDLPAATTAASIPTGALMRVENDIGFAVPTLIATMV
jgi:hypothetical protein